MKNQNLYIMPYKAKKKELTTKPWVYTVLSIIFGGYAIALLWCFIKLSM